MGIPVWLNGAKKQKPSGALMERQQVNKEQKGKKGKGQAAP
jgi:hypothetical protein